MSSWSYVSSKLGNVKSETRSIAKEVFDAAKAAGHDIWFMWGMGSSGEHRTGLALDFMVRNEAAGDWVRNYVWANRSRLRLQHVIWEQHITSTTNQPGVRRKMADRGNSTQNHYDHNHILLRAGSYRPPSGSSKPPTSGSKSMATLVNEVIAGKWGNGNTRVSRLRAAGYDPSAVQAAVNAKYAGKPSSNAPKKSVSTLATEVIAGKWGNGADRKKKLTSAGYNYTAVQAEVSKRLKGKSSKSVSTLATEVIQGKWGNGADRVRRLNAAGHNASAVQAEVNRRL